MRRHLLAVGVVDDAICVQPRDLGGEPSHELLRHPTRVLAALVAVERFLELPEAGSAAPRRGRTGEPSPNRVR